ncbi:MAG: histidine phosphatase family protein [Rhodospirillales bacterium]
MRTLYLLRHAKSSWKDEGVDDLDRPLTKRGRTAAKAMRRCLARRKVLPAQVLCSPSRRTRDTLAIVQGAFSTAVPIRFEKGIYMAEAHTLLRRLKRLGDSLGSVMIVGHSPGLQDLALLLSEGRDSPARQDLATKFPTCALAVIESASEHWSQWEKGGATVRSFVRARELAPA